MGNRAVIAFESMPEIGIYLHWNGGPESVLAFIECTKTHARGTGRNGDNTYAFARLIQTAANFLGVTGETSIGVGPLDKLDTDNYDNGLYWIGDDWEVTKRDHARGDPAKTVATLNKRGVEQYGGMCKYILLFQTESVKFETAYTD